MRTTAPSATENLRASVKAARSIGRWGIELTTQEADAILAENTRLAAENPLDRMTPQDCALGQHPDWAVEGEKSRPCPWCALEQANVERDQGRGIARRVYRELMKPRLRELINGDGEFAASAASLLRLDVLPAWLTDEKAGTTPRPTREPVHFALNGTASACGRRAAMLPKGVEFTLAFDPDDAAIDCRACRLYLEGLRAAAHAVGSPR